MNATSFLDTQINLSPSGANLSRSKPWLAKNLRFAIDKCPGGKHLGPPPILRVGAPVDRGLRYDVTQGSVSGGLIKHDQHGFGLSVGINALVL